MMRRDFTGHRLAFFFGGFDQGDLFGAGEVTNVDGAIVQSGHKQQRRQCLPLGVGSNGTISGPVLEMGPPGRGVI